MPRTQSRTHRSTLLALFVAAATIGGLLGALAATPASTRAGRLAGISGPGVSGIQIVNLSPTSTMTAVLDAYRQAGGAPIPIIRPNIAPLAAAEIFLPAEPGLRNGAYAGILSSDQPHAVIGRTSWPDSGGAVMFEGATAGGDAIVPVIFKGFNGQTSMVSIQNLETGGQTTVVVEVRASGSQAVVASQQFNIQPGTSITLDLGRHPAFQALPNGFVGTMLVAPVLSDWPIAVNSIVDIETSLRAVYGFGGDSGNAAEAVYVPRFRVEDPAYDVLAPAKHTTLLAVANPGAAAADFRVTYTGTGGSCAGQVVVHGDRSFAIPGGSNLLFDLGPGGAELATGSSGLPAGCFGTARIQAVADPSAPGAAARVAAVVVDIQRDRDGQATAASAYNAFPRGDASTTVLSPLFRNWVFSMSTELTVMNLGSSPAQVELRLKHDPDGTPVTDCGDACRAVIPPNMSHTFRAEAVVPQAIGMLGSATVLSDQPIVAIVDDLARGGPFDNSAFRAINATLSPDRPPRSHSAVPLLFQRTGGNPTAAPPPVPTVNSPSVDIFAIGFVDVTGGADPACPGCDGQYDPADEVHASQHPLPPLTFVLRNDQGQEVTRVTTTQLATLQRGQLRAPALTGTHTYTLELVGDPAGYQLCGNDMRSRQLTVDDFQLGSTREDFHFNTGSCVPDPNLTPVPIPTATAGPSATPAELPPTSTPASPAPVAGPKGSANTGVTVINLDPLVPHDLRVVAQRQGSGESTTVEHSAISAQGGYTFFLPSQGLSKGRYAGLFSADTPLAAVANSYWPDQRGVAAHEDSVPAADVLVPLVVKGAGGQNSLVSIQNYDHASATDVEVKLVDASGQEVAALTRNIAPGASITLDIGREPDFSEVPLGFVGTLRARAALRIAVSSFVDVEHSPLAIYGFQGEPAVAAAGTLFVPRAHAAVPVDPARPEAGLRMTRIAAANPGTVPVQVTLTFAGLGGTCAGQATLPSSGPLSIAAGGMRWLDIPAGGLPAGCTAAARIDATGGAVLAVAVDTVEAGQFVRTAGATNAFTAAQAGHRTILPFIRKQHVDGRISSDIAVMNVSSEPAALTLSLRDIQGRRIDCPVGCEAVVAPGLAHVFVPEAIDGWRSDTLGSGVIDSNQPVVVTVTDDSRVLKYDMAIYRGAAVPIAPSDIAPPALALPVMANQAQIRLDGPALTPPDPGWINLPSLVEPLHTLFLPIVGSLLGEPRHR